MRASRLALLAAWAALVAYALVAAPPRDVALERALWTFRFGDVDASVVALFLAMGLNADLFVVLLLRDGRLRRVPGWPVGLATFVLGSFVVLPYLALRGAPRPPPRAPGRITRIVSSRPVGGAIAIGYAAVLALAACGDPDAFARAFERTWFVHVMAIDFAVECVLLAWLVAEARHVDPPHREPRAARGLRHVPIVGPSLWNAMVVHDP